jgi:uncharacterized damage-inducible protein DinB
MRLLWRFSLVDVGSVVDERSGLLAFLAEQRQALTQAAHGLTEDQLRATPTASALSIGSLLKHVAFAERGWITRVTGGPEPRTGEAYTGQFDLVDGDTRDTLVTDLDAAGTETEAAIAAIEDLGQPVPVSPSHPASAHLDAWTVRWVLFHLIEEIARHAGHADIIRESVDGATSGDLRTAAGTP